MRPLAHLIRGVWASAMLLSAGATLQAETVNRIVAIVNDDVITEADVHTSTRALLDNRGEESLGVAPASVEGQRMILRQLIEQRLMLQEAKRSAISVDADEVLERLQALRERAGSDEAFARALDELHMSPEQLKMRIREQLLVERLIDAKVRSTILISPQEVAKELALHPELAKPGDRVRAAHLLIRVNETRSEAAARSRIEDLHRQLQAGADFAELATRYSEDVHAQDGGEMGWVAQGELMPELDTALFALTPGVCSQPLQTRLGFHLVKAMERRPAGSLSVMDANNAIFQSLYRRKLQEAMGRWLTQLKRKAYIEIPEPS